MTVHTRRWATGLVIGDLFALLLFGMIGQVNHGTFEADSAWLGLLTLTGEFALPWLVAGWILDAFRLERPNGAQALAWIGRTLNAWLVAAPIALLLRAFVRGEEILPRIFIIVTLGLGGLFMLIWRLAYLLVWRAVSSKRVRAETSI